MRLILIISLGLPLLVLTFTGCVVSKPAILDGGHYSPSGAATDEGARVEGPCYVIPEETFRALMAL